MAEIVADISELESEVSPSPSELSPSSGLLSSSDFLLLCLLFLLIALSSIFIVTFILRLIYKWRFDQQMRRHLGIFAANTEKKPPPSFGDAESGVYVVRPPVLTIPLYDDVFTMPPPYGELPQSNTSDEKKEEIKFAA